MYSRKMLLLLLILKSIPLLGMELASLSFDQDIPIVNNGGVPALKKLVLKRLAKCLVREDDKTLLSKIKILYTDAAQQCAQVLAEEELPVLHWKIIETNRKSAQLDHRRLNQRNLPKDKSWNNVEAASFSKDNSYLITVTSRVDIINGVCERDWVVYLWSMSEIENSMVAQEPCQTSKKSQLTPLSELVLPRGGVSGRLHLKLAWHPSSTIVAVSIDKGDGYILKIDQGILSFQGSFKVVSKELHDGIEGIEFDSTGRVLLIHAWQYYLFCLDLDAEDHSMSAQTILDASHCLVDDAFCAAWYPDGRILYIDCNDRMLITIDQFGKVLEKKSLILDEFSCTLDFDVEFKCFRPQRIIFTPNAQKVILHSRIECHENGRRSGFGGRIDICSLNDGFCVRPFEEDDVHLQFLDERYAIQIEESPDLRVYFCDLKALKSAIIIRWNIRGQRVVSISPKGKYVYLSLDDSLEERFLPFEPSVIMAQSPAIDAFTLEQLIVLAKMNYYGAKETLENPEDEALYRNLESFSPYKEVIREYFKE